MDIKQVMAVYGTQQRIADALGISQAAVSAWGGTIPIMRQYQLQVITKGRLRAGEPENGLVLRKQ